MSTVIHIEVRNDDDVDEVLATLEDMVEAGYDLLWIEDRGRA